MTQTFALSSTNDFVVGDDGSLVIATGIDAVLYACKNAALAQYQEMIYEYDKGVAYFDTVWTNSANVAQFESSLRAALLSVQGVTSIENLTVTITGDILNYSAIIETIYGTGALNG